MNCPHCNEEGLLGSKTCLACGRSMITAPPVPVAPAPGPLENGASAPPTVLCTACLQPFERPPADDAQTFCPGCRDFGTTAAGDVGQNQVELHPDTRPNADADPRAGTAVRHWKPTVRRRASLRVGPVAAAAALVIGLGTMGVVTFVNRERDPAALYLADAVREPATLALAPSPGVVVRLESTLALHIVREQLRDNFGSGAAAVLDIEQRTVQTSEVAFVRDDERGLVLDAAMTCRIAAQTGRVHGSDAREADIYPWQGHDATVRLLVPEDGTVQILAGAPAVVGRDVIPCLTVRQVGAPADVSAAGRVWRADVTLPLGVVHEGTLKPVAFPCTLSYGGRVTRGGATLHVLSLRGSAPRSAESLCDAMNRAEVSLRGALLYDAATGLIAEGHIGVDVSAWQEKGRIEEMLRVTGSFDVKRR